FSVMTLGCSAASSSFGAERSKYPSRGHGSLRYAAYSKESAMPSTYVTDPGRQDGLVLDVAIVGAGISGLYSGWRLRAGAFARGEWRQNPPKTHVFELGDRIGGRLLTAFLEGMPHVRCELGGMRYIWAEATPSNLLPGHQMVHNLGEKLQLTSIPFPMGDG